jgi:glutaredoxin-related protein
MLNLKRFLKYRDEAPEFKEIKEAGRVGLPCIVINNGEKILFDYNLLDIENIKE